MYMPCNMMYHRRVLNGKASKAVVKQLLKHNFVYRYCYKRETLPMIILSLTIELFNVQSIHLHRAKTCLCLCKITRKVISVHIPQASWCDPCTLSPFLSVVDLNYNFVTSVIKLLYFLFDQFWQFFWNYWCCLRIIILPLCICLKSALDHVLYSASRKSSILET